MKKVYLLIIGILLCIAPYCVNTYTMFRLIVISIGMILLIISYAIYEKKHLLLLLILPLLLVACTYTIDHILVSKLKRIPIYAYQIKSSDAVRTYNSFAYRVFDCDGTTTFDYGYKKNFLCEASTLEAMSVNDFLKEATENIKKYEEKFIKVKGKISKISGRDTIELSLYEEEINGLNGHVKFDASSILRIKTDADLSDLRIYDEFSVIGRVESKRQEKDSTIINLVDTLLLPNKDYKEYEFKVIENNNQGLKDYVKDKNIFLYGLDNIYVIYKNYAKYELSYAITDTRIIVDDLIKEKEPKIIKNELEEEIAQIYELEDFNIFKYDNKIILASKKSTFNDIKDANIEK